MPPERHLPLIEINHKPEISSQSAEKPDPIQVELFQKLRDIDHGQPIIDANKNYRGHIINATHGIILMTDTGHAALIDPGISTLNSEKITEEFLQSPYEIGEATPAEVIGSLPKKYENSGWIIYTNTKSIDSELAVKKAIKDASESIKNGLKKEKTSEERMRDHTKAHFDWLLKK